MVNYFGQVRDWLYEKRILPIIVRERHLPGYTSTKDILESMKKPYVPEEPSEFARTLGSLLRGELMPRSSDESRLVEVSQ